MSGYLIAEEGSLAGLTISFEEGDLWIIGRDPDMCFQVVEDPMVSRKHVSVSLSDQGYLIDNLSSVNPAQVNGKPISDPLILQEGDIVQIGNVFFRFTKHTPQISSEDKESERPTPTIYEENTDLDDLVFKGGENARFIIKVISGPNAGAEFNLYKDTTYIIGKDPQTCAILFQDLSVSRQHAKIVVHQDETISIEDLNSLNKVIVNGIQIEAEIPLKTQDLVSLGTTSFLMIDQMQTRETIVSPALEFETLSPAQDKSLTEAQKSTVKSHWKQLRIPIRHLVLACLVIFLLLLAVGGIFSLFKSHPVEMVKVDQSKEIQQALKNFPEVAFSFNPNNGNIFLLGHVMTEIDHQEMIYLLRSLPFIRVIEDNVIIDELVWESTNALLMKNPNWRGVSLTSLIPGRFVLRGYVQTLSEASSLAEYINLNFPYLDKLDNQVVVENTLEAQIQSLLLEKQLVNVTFQVSNGELILSGRIGLNLKKQLDAVLNELKKLKGIRTVKNFVILTQPTNDVVNITGKYQVTGNSKFGNISQYVVINGKILSQGDYLDGMLITKINENTVFLEKDGIKYAINYNQQ